ncbi:ABC transporter substrate-binding protein [Micrococcales bacterium 31B]|nr:ABC transporter substrate-binding protein [Micrococcales bacterium 31B]
MPTPPNGEPPQLGRRALFRLGLASSAAVGAVTLLSACGTQAIPGAEAWGASPGPGGLLRVGVVGGSTKDTLDAHMPVTHPDQARIVNLYDGLAGFDSDFAIELRLAESIEPSADATYWTITLREDLTFHDGRPVRAQDVAATIKRIVNPENPKSVAPNLAAINLDAMEVRDDRTLVLHLNYPDVTLLDAFAQYSCGIVPEDYDESQPIGAGPFKLVSFQPGQQSVFTAHEGYWREQEPHISQLIIIDFPDDTARVNALLGSQVDAIDQLPIALIPVVNGGEGLKVLQAQTGSWIPFTMRVDRPPFDDVRVRQALRLVVDREQMVRQVLNGQGTIGNDLYAPFDPAFNKSLPQRTRDIAQAKALLKAAGHENLEVELVTAPIAAGAVEAATVFAAQAAEAGITITLRKIDAGEFYGDNYLQWDFAQDFWFTRNFLPQAAASSLPDSPYNETHFNDPEFIDLVQRARRTVDETERNKLIAQAQKIEYERGGFIIWGFTNQVDGFRTRVSGLVPDHGGLPLSGYNFRSVTLAD